MSELLSKLPHGLFLGLFMAYLAWGYYDFTTAETSPLQERHGQLKAAEASLAKAQADLARDKRSQDELQTHRLNAIAVAQQLERVGASLALDFDMPGLVKMIATEATKTGLRVSSIKPVEQKKEELYTEQSFELNYTGAFVQLLMFLNRISSLERIVRVDTFEVHRATGQANQKVTELTGTLIMKAYKYTGIPNSKPGETKPASPSAPGGGT